MKYSFAITNRFGETLSVEGADSFDEAIARVETGITQRDLVIGRRLVESGQASIIPDDIKLLLIREGKLTVEQTSDTTAEPDPAPEAPSEATPETPPASAPAAPETPASAPEAPAAPEAAPATPQA